MWNCVPRGIKSTFDIVLIMTHTYQVWALLSQKAGSILLSTILDIEVRMIQHQFCCQGMISTSVCSRVKIGLATIIILKENIGNTVKVHI